MRDFKPVANLFRSVKPLRVPAATAGVDPSRTFVRYARARPGALNFATGGVGSSNHVDAALFASAAKLSSSTFHNGPSAGIAAVASGDAQMMIVSITTGLPLAQAGKVRALAVFSEARSPLMPDVPTAAEQGFDHLDLNAWMGLVGPAATPAAVVQKIHAGSTHCCSRRKQRGGRATRDWRSHAARRPPSAARSKPIMSAGAS